MTKIGLLQSSTRAGTGGPVTGPRPIYHPVTLSHHCPSASVPTLSAFGRDAERPHHGRSAPQAALLFQPAPPSLPLVRRGRHAVWDQRAALPTDDTATVTLSPNFARWVRGHPAPRPLGILMGRLTQRVSCLEIISASSPVAAAWPVTATSSRGRDGGAVGRKESSSPHSHSTDAPGPTSASLRTSVAAL